MGHLQMVFEEKPKWRFDLPSLGTLVSVFFQSVASLLGVTLVFAIAYTLLSVSRERSVVVEALSVSKNISDMGFSGQVIASRLVDRMAYLEWAGKRVEGRHDIVAQPPDIPIKVQLTSVGLSMDEVYGYLRTLVSNDRNVMGEAVGESGRVDMRLRLDGDAAVCDESRSANEIDKLIVDLADCIYKTAQKERYARYLALRYPQICDTSKDPCRRKALNDRAGAEDWFGLGTADASVTTEDRAWAWEGLGKQVWNDGGDLEFMSKFVDALGFAEIANREQFGNSIKDYARASRYFSTSLALYDLPDTRAHLIDVSFTLIDASDLAGNRQVQDGALKQLDRLDAYRSTTYTPPEIDQMTGAARAWEAQLRGDFAGAALWWTHSIVADCHKEAAAFGGLTYCNNVNAVARDHVLVARAMAHDDSVATEDDVRKLDVGVPALAALGRWSELNALCRSFGELCKKRDPLLAMYAYSFAADGSAQRLANAQALIAPTRLDCDACLLARGWIAAGIADRDGADQWFYTAAAKRNPHLPLPFCAWANFVFEEAQSLQSKNRDPSSLIAKGLALAEWAHKQGPENADALEIWGKFLLLQNRPQEALEKFAAARELAPNWMALRQDLARAAAISSGRRPIPPPSTPDVTIAF